MIRIILHGKVAGDPEVRETVLGLRKEGHLVEISVTREGGDAARLTGEAVADAHSGRGNGWTLALTGRQVRFEGRTREIPF